MCLTKPLRVLTLFTLVTLSCLSPAAGTLHGQSQNAHTFAGSWIVRVTSNVEPPFINLTTATNDGRLINVATDGLAGVGEWQKTRNGLFAVTFLHIIEQDGQRLRIKIRGTIELAKGGGEFDGRFFTEIFDANGNLIGTFEGVVHGTRFGVEPL